MILHDRRPFRLFLFAIGIVDVTGQRYGAVTAPAIFTGLLIFQRKGVALVSVAESLDTGSAAGRLVLNIMVSVSQWEREAIGERTRDALRLKRSRREYLGNAPYGYRLATGSMSSRTRMSRPY